MALGHALALEAGIMVATVMMAMTIHGPSQQAQSSRMTAAMMVAMAVVTSARQQAHLPRRMAVDTRSQPPPSYGVAMVDMVMKKKRSNVSRPHILVSPCNFWVKAAQLTQPEKL
jgi:hypothetical protein